MWTCTRLHSNDEGGHASPVTRIFIKVAGKTQEGYKKK